MLGKLTVKPISAQLKKDKDNVGAMDPYVTMKIGDQLFQTVQAVSQGVSPVWNEQFTFNISGDDKLRIKVLDKDIGKDDFLGKVNIRISHIVQRPHVQEYFDLRSKILGRNVGRILLAFDWFPQEKPVVIPPQHGFVAPAQTTQVYSSQTQQPYTISPSTDQRTVSQTQLGHPGYIIPPQQTSVYVAQPQTGYTGPQYMASNIPQGYQTVGQAYRQSDYTSQYGTSDQKTHSRAPQTGNVPKNIQYSPQQGYQTPLSTKGPIMSLQTNYAQPYLDRPRDDLGQNRQTGYTDYQGQGSWGQGDSYANTLGKDMTTVKREEIKIEEYSKTHPESLKPIYQDPQGFATGTQGYSNQGYGGQSYGYYGKGSEYESRRI